MQSRVAMPMGAALSAGPPERLAINATYGYADNGEQQYIVDAKGSRAKFEYDGFDRQSKWIFPSTTGPASYNPSDHLVELNLKVGDPTLWIHKDWMHIMEIKIYIGIALGLIGTASTIYLAIILYKLEKFLSMFPPGEGMTARPLIYISISIIVALIGVYLIWSSIRSR